MRALSLSRSTPALATPSERLSHTIDREDSPNGEIEKPSENQSVAMGGAKEKGHRDPADDFYMTSTQIAYMSGMPLPSGRPPV